MLWYLKFVYAGPRVNGTGNRCKMNHVDSKEFEEWEVLIGKAIIAFGEIELVTYKCLMYLPTEHIFEVVADLPFTKRIDLVCQLIQEKTLSDTIQDDFIKLLKNARQYAEIRNLIAHNPVQVSVYEHHKTGDFFVRPEIIALRKKGKVVDINRMRIFAKEIEALSSELINLMSGLFDKFRHKD